MSPLDAPPAIIQAVEPALADLARFAGILAEPLVAMPFMPGFRHVADVPMTVAPAGTAAQPTEDTSGPFVHTFASFDIGSESGRTAVIIVVGNRFRTNTTVASVVVNGTEFTCDDFALTPGDFVSSSIWRGAPTGSSVTVTVTLAAQGNGGVGISAFAVHGRSPVPGTAQKAPTDEANSASVTLTTPAGGFSIFGSANQEQGTAYTWTNATEHGDADVDGCRASAAHRTTAGSATTTADAVDGEAYAMIGIPYSAG